MGVTERRGAWLGGRARFRRLVLQLRTERGGPRRDAVAVGLGVFIGCTPLYGLHLALSLLTADLLRLNRLKVYLAANISNPLFLPFLAFAEVQTGAWIRSGQVHTLTREALSAVDPWIFGLDLVIGAVALGVGLGVVLGLLTFLAVRDRTNDPAFAALVERAAARYAAHSLTAWEFASSKLRTDFVYRRALDRSVLPGGDVLLDIGCGQGLMLALLLDANPTLVERSGDAAASSTWPRYEQLVGIETRPRVARLAAQALASDRVTILGGRAEAMGLPPCSAALCFDVLHMLPPDAQLVLLRQVRAALRPGGVVLVREADAGAGWRFALVRIGNRLKALSGGRWGQRLAFRTRAAWEACFAEAGFASAVLPPPETPLFGNVLFRLVPIDERTPAPDPPRGPTAAGAA